jgi:hypothetical protein
LHLLYSLTGSLNVTSKQYQKPVINLYWLGPTEYIFPEDRNRIQSLKRYVYTKNREVF